MCNAIAYDLLCDRGHRNDPGFNAPCMRCSKMSALKNGIKWSDSDYEDNNEEYTESECGRSSCSRHSDGRGEDLSSGTSSDSETDSSESKE